MMPEKMVVVGASHDRPLGMGMLFTRTNLIVTAFGVGGAAPPREFAGVCALADTVLRPISAPRCGPANSWHDEVPQLSHEQVAPLRQASHDAGGHHAVR